MPEEPGVDLHDKLKDMEQEEQKKEEEEEDEGGEEKEKEEQRTVIVGGGGCPGPGGDEGSLSQDSEAAAMKQVEQVQCNRKQKKKKKRSKKHSSGLKRDKSPITGLTEYQQSFSDLPSPRPSSSCKPVYHYPRDQRPALLVETTNSAYFKEYNEAERRASRWFEGSDLRDWCNERSSMFFLPPVTGALSRETSSLCNISSSLLSTPFQSWLNLAEKPGYSSVTSCRRSLDRLTDRTLCARGGDGVGKRRKPKNDNDMWSLLTGQ